MKIIGATLLALLALSAGGCSFFDTPSAVVKKFYERVEAGKVNDAYELITLEGKAMLRSFGGPVNALSSMTKKIKAKGGIKSINIQSEEVTGDMAEVVFSLAFGDGTMENNSDKLIKEEGAWKIAIRK